MLEPKQLALLFVIGACIAFVAIDARFASREAFSDQPSSGADDLVRAKYKELLGRQPTQYELRDYKAMLDARELDARGLEDALKTTQEYKTKVGGDTFENSKQSSDTAMKLNFDAAPSNSSVLDPSKYKDVALYHEIIDVYMKTLERLPSPAELDHHYNKVDASRKSKSKQPYTTTTLRSLLQQTREYHILKSNQTNRVYTELPSNASDRQVTVKVREIYQRVFGSLPTAHNEEYAKGMFVKFELDEKRLEEFLRGIKRLEASSSSSDKDSNKAVKRPDLWDRAVKQDDRNDLTKPSTLKSSKDPSNIDLRKYGNDRDEFYAIMHATQDAMHDRALKELICKSTMQRESCEKQTIQKESHDKTAATRFAGSQSSRNADQLRMACARSSSTSQYTNAQRNQLNHLVLREDQAWSVPQQRPPACYGATSQVSPLVGQTALIGTLLADASDTKVGSIMPKFIYKEV